MEETETPGVPSPVRLAFRVAYFGERFMGSQLQPGLRTVEGEFIAACTRLGLFDDWRTAGFVSSGRTDRGVNALGQVVALTTDHPGRAIATLNIQLPFDLWCTGYSPVALGFHPRYDARWRTYRYYFREYGLDAWAMNAAASLFEGTHDFSGFIKVSDKNPIRTVLSSSVAMDGDIVYFEVTAQSFLWHMVRCMATALAGAGAGTCGADAIEERLRGADACNKGLHPSPPEGLVLWDIGYDISWISMNPGERRTAEITDRRGYHQVMNLICELFGSGSGSVGPGQGSPENVGDSRGITNKTNDLVLFRREGR
jgi:tRNA pseudouridine38-40 synthase